MSPEFRRNVWLEMTPRRIIFMAATLLLVFLAAAFWEKGDRGFHDDAFGLIARVVFYFIVVFWGTRNAALSIVGEIRDRTWDLQRLSSLDAGELAWGKLFGSTIYNWFGGALCLGVIAVDDLARQNAPTMAIDLVYFVGVGVISQAAALLASLIAVRRRQTHTRLEVFAYQVVGIAAAIVVHNVWESADPAGALVAGQHAVSSILWWGRAFDARPFLLVSLALFAGWTLIGCHREMRLELQMHNGPWVWVGFLAFMGLYVAGFDAWLIDKSAPVSLQVHADVISRRLGLAATTCAMLTYVMVLLEPKDRVLYRWLGSAFAAGRIGRAFASLQGWMMAYAAAIGVAALLVARVVAIGHGALSDIAPVVAAMGLITRDVAIFVLLQTLPGRRRGDVAAVVTLIALYGLIPAILDGLGLKAALGFFYPQPTVPYWLGVVVIWCQALAVVVFTSAQGARGRERMTAQPAG